MNVNITPSPKTIQQVGEHLTNAVQSANNVVKSLNDVSKQLTNASKNVKKNSPAIANAATNVLLTNADSMSPFIGSANAKIVSNLPKSVVNAQVQTMVGGVVDAIQQASVVAKNAADAIQSGLNQVNKGADWVEKNVSRVDTQSVNNVVKQNVNNAVNAGRNGLNSVANTTIPPVRLNANVNSSHVNAIKNIAKSVKNVAGGKHRKRTRKINRK